MIFALLAHHHAFSSARSLLYCYVQGDSDGACITALYNVFDMYGIGGR